MAGRSHLSVNNSPDFLSEVLSELTGVSNDDNTTLEGLDSLGKGTQGVTVQVVGGLVQDDDMRTLPRAGGKDNLDTLTTGETAHTGVGNKLSIETELGAVLFDLLADQRTELTAGKGLLLVNLGNHLGVGLDDLVTGNPGVVAGHHGSPLLALHADVVTQQEGTLVLVSVLELTTGVDTNDPTGGTVDLVDLVHGLLVLIGDNLVGTVHGFTVLTGLETPLDVLGGSAVEVVINVGESVLLDVGDTDVLVLVDITGGRDQLTGQNVDQCRLTGTVGTDDSNTGSQRHLEGNIGNLGTRSARVLEGHVGDTDDSLGLGLDTLQETGLGELEFHVGSTQLVVRAGGRNLLHELAQGTTVTLKLEVTLVVNDVLDNVVQELAVVRDNDGSARGRAKVVLQPGNVLDVQVVGRLIQEKDIRLLEDSTGKGQLHLPTTRKGGNGAVELLTEETELLELGFDLLLLGVQANLAELLHGPANDGLLSIGRIQVVLNVDSLDLILLGETLKLLVVDSTHESGLTSTVGTEETVTLTTLQAEMGLVQQDLGTIGQGERAVAQILTLLLVGEDCILSSGIRRSTLAEGLSNSLSLLLTDNGGDVGESVLGPALNLANLLVNELTSNGSNVVDDGLGLLDLFVELGGEDLLEDTSNSGDVTGGGDLGNLAILDVTNTAEGCQGLFGLATSLRVGQGVKVVGKTRHQLGQEGSDDLRVLDKLTHVVDDDSRLTLDGSLTLDKTTVKQGNHDSEGRSSDIGNEGGGTEQVNGLGDVLGLGDTLNEFRNETLDILVNDQTADLLHGGVSGLLDLGLSIPHSLGDSRNQGGDTVRNLSGSGLNERVEALESAQLLSPLLGGLQGLENRRNDGLDGIAVDALDNGNSGTLSGVLDVGHLVTNGSEDRAEESHEVRLNTGGDGGVGSNGPDSVASALAGIGILLIRELLLEIFGEPMLCVSKLVRDEKIFLSRRGINILQGEGLFRDRTAEEVSNVVGSGVDLILSRGDVEVLEQVVKDRERLSGLLAGDSRNRGGSSSRHFGRKKV